MDWIELAQDRDRLWMFVNLIKNTRAYNFVTNSYLYRKNILRKFSSMYDTPFSCKY